MTQGEEKNEGSQREQEFLSELDTALKSIRITDRDRRRPLKAVEQVMVKIAAVADSASRPAGWSEVRVLHLAQTRWLLACSDADLPLILEGLLWDVVAVQADRFRWLNPRCNSGEGAMRCFRLRALELLIRRLLLVRRDGQRGVRHCRGLLEENQKTILEGRDWPSPIDVLSRQADYFLFRQTQQSLIDDDGGNNDPPHLDPESLEAEGHELFHISSYHPLDEVWLLEVYEQNQPDGIAEAARKGVSIRDPDLTPHRLLCFLVSEALRDFSEDERQKLAKVLNCQSYAALRQQHNLAEQALYRIVAALLNGFWTGRLGVPETTARVAPEAREAFERAVLLLVLSEVQAILAAHWCQVDSRGKAHADQVKKQHGLTGPAAFGLFMKETKRRLVRALEQELDRPRPRQPEQTGSSDGVVGSAPGTPRAPSPPQAWTRHPSKGATMAPCNHQLSLSDWQRFCEGRPEVNREAMAHHLPGCSTCLLHLLQAREQVAENDAVQLLERFNLEPLEDREPFRPPVIWDLVREYLGSFLPLQSLSPEPGYLAAGAGTLQVRDRPGRTLALLRTEGGQPRELVVEPGQRLVFEFRPAASGQAYVFAGPAEERAHLIFPILDAGEQPLCRPDAPLELEWDVDPTPDRLLLTFLLVDPEADTAGEAGPDESIVDEEQLLASWFMERPDVPIREGASIVLQLANSTNRRS